ncbi:class I SAM-dependent methyltransferase [Paenisporosarcina sp. TG20]|uniref:class I SAM-dependent DNA methyltransferase n=1 Tax=Paenisporosarcina sp. TG20 TaxID=1211706 RepID=UPI0003065A42|nr:class I SAM-dependent methyltransferase [Paenisporosarcina sp. TG20]
MSSYKEFAHIYDALMTDIPYDKYVDKVVSSVENVKGKSLLDVGCGTGVLSAKFAEQGFLVQGVDLSGEMLAIASNRFQKEGLNIPLFHQSMTELDGFQEVDVAILAIDSLNYLEDETQILQTLHGIYKLLKEGGHLFFDVHSIYKMDELFLDGPFTYEDEHVAYIWHTENGEFPHSVYHDLTFFIKNSNGTYDRFEESHFQRSYDVSSYLAFLKEAGFSHVEVTADWEAQSPENDTERIFFHAIK